MEDAWSCSYSAKGLCYVDPTHLEGNEKRREEKRLAVRHEMSAVFANDEG